MSDELPPLPPPRMVATVGYPDAWTIDQMHEYARAAAALERRACEEVAWMMPLQTHGLGNEYRGNDDCKALAWDIAMAIRARGKGE